MHPRNLKFTQRCHLARVGNILPERPLRQSGSYLLQNTRSRADSEPVRYGKEVVIDNSRLLAVDLYRMKVMPSAPGIERISRLWRCSSGDVVRRRKFPNPVFSHKERKILRVVVAFVGKDIERHTPEHLLFGLVPETKFFYRGEDVVIRTHIGSYSGGKMGYCGQRLDMMSCPSIPVKALRHEMFYSIKFKQSTFAGFDSGGARLLHCFVLAPSAIWIFRRSKLDYPMLETIR